MYRSCVIYLEYIRIIFITIECEAVENTVSFQIPMCVIILTDFLMYKCALSYAKCIVFISVEISCSKRVTMCSIIKFSIIRQPFVDYGILNNSCIYIDVFNVFNLFCPSMFIEMFHCYCRRQGFVSGT